MGRDLSIASPVITSHLKQTIGLDEVTILFAKISHLCAMSFHCGLSMEKLEPIMSGISNYRPYNHTFLKILATSKLASGKVDDALLIYDEIFKKSDPEVRSASMFLHFGIALMRKGDKDQALEFFDKALDLSKDRKDMRDFIKLYKSRT